MEEFDFIEEMELKANRRFQLLELRDGEVQEFRNYKMVPINEKEIPRDTFTVSFMIQAAAWEKPTICIWENKDADQHRGNHEADQCLLFRYNDSTLPLLLKS